MEDIERLLGAPTCLNLKEKLLISLGEDFADILLGALKYSLHPTREDALLELSRSEILFISLLQALATRNVLMSLRLLQEVENWCLLPRISAYMGGKLSVEFSCIFELIKGAGEFIHTLQQSGLVKISKKVINYIDFLVECAKKDKQGEIEPVDASPSGKQARRKNKKQRRTSVKRTPTCQIDPTESVTVGSSSQTEIDPTEFITVGSSSQTEIDPTESVTVGLSSQTETDPTESVTVGSSSQTESEPTEIVTVGSSSQTEIDPTESLTVSSSSQTEIDPTESVSVGSSSQTETDPTETVTVGSSSEIEIDPTESVTVDLSSQTEAAQAIEIECCYCRLRASTSSSSQSQAAQAIETQCCNCRLCASTSPFSQSQAVVQWQEHSVASSSSSAHTSFHRNVNPSSSTSRHGRRFRRLMERRNRYAVNKATKSLFECVARNDTEGITNALESGADVTRKYLGGSTALHFAALEGYIESIGLLLRAGAPVDSVNIHGNQPLHLTAMRGHIGAFIWLVSCGADIHAVGEGGRTPEMWAYEGGFHLVSELILNLANQQ